MFEGLFLAILNEDLKTINEFIKGDFDLNKEYDELGIHWNGSLYGNNFKLYDFLGGEKKYGQIIPFTPLQCSSFIGNEVVTKLFVNSGSEISLQNSIIKETPRSIAGHSENHHIVRLFKYYEQDSLNKRNNKKQLKKDKKEKKENWI